MELLGLPAGTVRWLAQIWLTLRVHDGSIGR